MYLSTRSIRTRTRTKKKLFFPAVRQVTKLPPRAKHRAKQHHDRELSEELANVLSWDLLNVSLRSGSTNRPSHML